LSEAPRMFPSAPGGPMDHPLIPGGLELRSRLHLMVLTDPGLAGARGVMSVVEDALRGGCRAIQLRDKAAGARDLLETARTLRTLTREYGALLLVNDRLDVALAAAADGVHLGPDDLPVEAVRRVVPGPFLIGYSTDDPAEAKLAEAAGANYLGCGTVHRTTSKGDAGHPIGLEGLDRVARAVQIPVIGIGGIGPVEARGVANTAAAGIAVLGAVMSAADPAGMVAALLSPFVDRDGGGGRPRG
jgi:thiamine-phosphate pyrophosphorylase